MRKCACIITIFLLLVLIAEAQDKPHFTTYWENGLHTVSNDGNFKFNLGGRIHYDVMFISEDDSLKARFNGENGAELRRAWLYTSGTLFGNVKFKFQVDFAQVKVLIKDAYLRLTKIPVVGNFQVGNFKQPFSLEMMTSSNYFTEMERPLISQFDHNRDLGFMVFNHHFDKRLSWYAGYFYPSDIMDRYKGNQYQITARVSGLPFYKTDNGYKVFNLDMAYSYHYKDNTTLLYGVKPEAHLAPSYLDLNIEAVKNSHLGNAGVAFILGSLSFQSGYTFIIIHPASNAGLYENKYYLDAYFGTLSWFITGEHKNFNKGKAAFDRVYPDNNFGAGGAGAFEVSLRYSSINLSDNDLEAGVMNNLTAGLNWYLNPAVRIMFNYIHSTIVDLGESNIFQMRFQVAF